MHPRLTLDYVKEIIESNDYILLSNNYVNAHTKLKIKCDRGHIYDSSWDVFNRGCRCNKCSTERVVSKQRHSLNYIKNKIENEDYDLISKDYKNAKTPLKVICPNNHIVEFSWNYFQGGGRCPICFGTPKKTINEIKEYSKSLGYELSSKKYNNALEKLEFRCPENHIFEVSWNNFSGKDGSRCPICWNIKNRGSNHHMWKGGISFEPYCEIFSDKEFRDFIKHRDGNKCLNPSCTKKSKILAIHHIDYNKKKCRQENLITICISCNSTANVNRDWHTSWYRSIMYRRYGFIYKGDN